MQSLLNTNYTAAYSFKPNLGEFYNLQVSQYSENNEVKHGTERIMKNIKTTFFVTSITSR